MAMTELIDIGHGLLRLKGTADVLAEALTKKAKKALGTERQAEYVAFEISAPSKAERDALMLTMEQFYTLVLAHSELAKSDRLKLAAKLLAPSPALSLSEIRLEAANSRVREHVLTSTTWYTASELAKLAGSTSSNRHALASKWKAADKIFAIVDDGVDKFPAYALDEDEGYRPRQAIHEIISAFGPKWSGWKLAIWFATANSYLDGKQPQEVISVDPDLVIEAAKDKAEGIQHG